MDNKTKANQIFAMNPNQKKVHITTDGMGFFDEHKANDHQKKLGGKGKPETFKFEDSEYGKEVLKNKSPENDAPKELADMKMDELKAVAESEGVDITGLKSKKDVAAKIQELRDSKPEE